MTIVLVIAGLALLVFVHEAGHFLFAKFFKMRVEEFGFGFPPRLFGKKIGKTLYSVNLIPFGGFVKLFGEEKEVKSKEGFQNQPIRKRLPVLVAGVCMNFVVGWLLFSVVFMAGAPRHLAIADVASGSPAAIAGIESGDIITEASIGGTRLADPIDAAAFIDGVKASSVSQITLTVLRGAESHTISMEKRENPPQGEGALGVGLAEVGFDSQPFFQAFLSGLKEAWGALVLIAISLFHLVVGIFTTPSVLQEVAGPVGIVFLASQASALGFVYFLELLALISINLVIINLIPFPALDGGRILFLIIEKIKGSPVSRKLELAVNGIGFAALLILMVLVTVQDITRFWK